MYVSCEHRDSTYRVTLTVRIGSVRQKNCCMDPLRTAKLLYDRLRESESITDFKNKMYTIAVQRIQNQVLRLLESRCNKAINSGFGLLVQELSVTRGYCVFAHGFVLDQVPLTYLL